MSKPKLKAQTAKKDRSMALAVGFFAVAGALAAYSLVPDNAAVTSKNDLLHNEKYEAKVNRHLMLTNEKMEMQRKRMMMENEALAPEYFHTRPGKVVTHSVEGDTLDQDTYAVDVARELDRDSKVAASPSTPDELIQAEIFNKRQEQEYSRQYKEEYARQFVANAAKNGWKVKLNSEYKVLSVTPIRNPTAQAPDLFKSGGGSAQ